MFHSTQLKASGMVVLPVPFMPLMRVTSPKSMESSRTPLKFWMTIRSIVMRILDTSKRALEQVEKAVDEFFFGIGCLWGAVGLLLLFGLCGFE